MSSIVAVALPPCRNSCFVMPKHLSNFCIRSVSLKCVGDCERVVVAHQRQRHADDRQLLAARGIVDPRNVFSQAFRVQERRYRHGFFGFFVDHHGHADAAIRMAAAAQLTPVRFRSMDQVREIRERAHERDREPVANGFAQTGLVLHVVREMRKRVALRFAAFIGDRFVAAGERNRLEARKGIFLGLSSANCTIDPTCSLLMPLTIVMTGTISTPASCRFSMALQLHIEQIADLAMRVGALPMPSN